MYSDRVVLFEKLPRTRGRGGKTYLPRQGFLTLQAAVTFYEEVLASYTFQ
jgi:hypothetical protein